MLQFLPLWDVKPEIDPNVVRPGGYALLIVLGLLAIVALLSWSMIRHMRKVRASFGDEISDAQPFEQDDDVEVALSAADSSSSSVPQDQRLGGDS